MKKFEVEITETLQRTVTVEAASQEEAERMVDRGWRDGDYVLTDEDFEALAQKNRLHILDAYGLQNGQEVRTLPNLRAGTAVFQFERM